jgi:hypothetical protein
MLGIAFDYLVLGAVAAAAALHALRMLLKLGTAVLAVIRHEMIEVGEAVKQARTELSLWRALMRDLAARCKSMRPEMSDVPPERVGRSEVDG